MQGELEEKRVTVRLDGELAGAMDVFCHRTRRKNSDVLREALVRFLEKNGELNQSVKCGRDGKEAA